MLVSPEALVKMDVMEWMVGRGPRGREGMSVPRGRWEHLEQV
jgi:hypothetical protein